MTDLVDQELRQKVALKLLSGVNPDIIVEEMNCDASVVFSVFESQDFLEMCKNSLDKSLKSKALRALDNIDRIANDKKASQATRLKANAYIVDKALDMNSSGKTSKLASDMSERELQERLNELQGERAKRAKPVESDEIQQDTDIDTLMK